VPLVRNATATVAGHTVFAASSVPSSLVALTGVVPAPDINVALADSGDFGAVCSGGHADLNLTLFNQGRCDLTIDNISLLPDAGAFELPANLTFPLVLSHDADFNVPVRFAPTTCFDVEQARLIEIASDDPDESLVDINVKGSSPCPHLVADPVDMAGLFAFPATVTDPLETLGCYTDRTVTLRNNALCPLTIDNISALGLGNALDYAVLQPSVFPVTLPGGEETLNVTVRFTPQADAAPLTPTELLGLLTVVSNDPSGNKLVNLCGEGVTQSGVRILVTDTSSGQAVPVASVDTIGLTSKGLHAPQPINLNFTDRALQTATVCGKSVKYHVDQETLPATDTTGSNPQSSYLASAKEGNLQTSQAFGLGQCEFKEMNLQVRSSTSPVCVLAPKGASCTTDGECCSGKCGGPAGGKTCK
jgi:hypothetical protein